MNKILKSKTFIKVFFCVAAVFTSVSFAEAQAQYKTGVGLLIDVGDGGTLVGPHVKHFFDSHQAGEASLQFGNGLTLLQLMYQYHQPVEGAEGLQWYIGLGGGLGFPKYGSKTLFAIVPAVGLDYKVSGTPIDLFFDWRPKFMIYKSENEFNAAKFGLGLRFILNN